MIASLLAAQARGVDVHVLLGDQPMGPGGRPKNQDTVDKLSAAGIKAKIFTGHYLHAKGIVTATQAFVGSQNFTAGGLAQNREVGEIFDDAGVVAKLSSIFKADEAM